MSLLLLFHGASTGGEPEPEPEPEPDRGGSRARRYLLRMPRQRRPDDEFWWWEMRKVTT
jgi:hypothetical protein